MLPSLARARAPGSLLAAAGRGSSSGGGRGGGGGGGGRGWGGQQQRQQQQERRSDRPGGSNGGGWQQRDRPYNRDDNDDDEDRRRGGPNNNNNNDNDSSWRRQQDARLAPPPPRGGGGPRKARPPPEAPAPAAATPVGGSGLGARCYGCGAPLQTSAPGAAGYVAGERYATRKRHRQLDTCLCGRCADLCNGAMVPAVADFSQRAAAGALGGVGGGGGGGAGGAAAASGGPTALLLPVSATLPSAAAAVAGGAAAPGDAAAAPAVRALVDPETLREQLLHVRARRALVVLLADLLDASGTLLPRVRDMVGRNPVVLVGTKLDLLPPGTKPRRVAEWLADSAARRRLSVAATHVVSAHTGEGVPQAVARVLRERKGRDVYVIGAANVGKSAFVRAALREMARGDGGNFDAAALAHGSRLPVESAMPGTTLGLIALRAFEAGGALYDTPGVHLHHRVPHLLSPSELRLLHPRRALAPYVAACGAAGAGAGGAAVAGAAAPLPAPLAAADDDAPRLASFVWGGLVRVDVLSAPDDAALAFYGPPAMRVATFAAAATEGPALPPPLPAALSAAAPLAERAAAVAAALGASLLPPPSPPSSSSRSSAAADGDSSPSSDKWLAAADSVAARGGLVAHDVCVPAPPLVAPAPMGPGETRDRGRRRRPRRDAALADVAISGVPGWIAVHSPRGRRDVHLRVWAPRGVEVFLRPAIPVPQPALVGAGGGEDDGSDDEGEDGNDGGAERRVFSALADAMGERGEADGPGEPLGDSEAVRLLLGSVLEASAGGMARAAARATKSKKGATAEDGGGGAQQEKQAEEDDDDDDDPTLAGLDLASLGLEGQEDAVRALLSYGGAFGDGGEEEEEEEGGDGAGEDDEDDEDDEEEEEEEEDVAAEARPTRGRAALAAMRSRRQQQQKQKQR